MDMRNRPARLGFAAALVALLLGPLVFGAQTALAHPTQATYYGTDQEPGTTITASIDGETCGSFDADDDGVWVIHVDEGDCNGNAAEGATVNFHIGDAPAAESVTWTAGDLQALALTLAPTDGDGMDGDGMDDTDAMDGDGMDDGDDKMDGEGMTPADKGDTGNSGFATGPGPSSMLLVLALGVLAAAGVAGARTATGRLE